MRPPSRPRRILKWTGAAACAVIFAAWAFSYHTQITYTEADWRWVLSTADGNVELYVGGQRVGAGHLGWHTDPSPRQDFSISKLFQFSTPGSFELYFGTGVPTGAKLSRIPFWCVALLTAIPTAWLWRRDRRLISCSPDPLLCVRCGYDLTGNTSGVCSECGEKSPTPGAAVATSAESAKA